MKMNFEDAGVGEVSEKPKKKNKKVFRESMEEPVSVAEMKIEESEPATPEEVVAALEALKMGDSEKGEGYVNAGATLKDLTEIMAQQKPAEEAIPEEMPEPVVAEIPEPEVVVPQPIPVEKAPEAPKVVLEKKEKIPKREQVNIHRPEKQPHHEQRPKFEDSRKAQSQEDKDAYRHEVRDIDSDVRDRQEIDKWFKDLAKAEKEKKVAEKRAEEIKQKIANQMKKPEVISGKINVQKGSEKLPSFWEKLTKFVSSLGSIKEDSKPKLDGKETENN